MPTRRQRVASSIAVGVVLAACGLTGALWLLQDKLIYPAPHYGERGLEGLPAGLTPLHAADNPASIVGFYRANTGATVPAELWLLFGGNGDAALRWDPLVAPSADAETAFLMVEYPGYGARRGKPSPESLLSGTEETLAALAKLLGTSAAELEPRVSVVGFSLGAAAALQYAAKHGARRIILFAPFTSMLDMARRVVGSPLCYLLSHRYDNERSLRALASRGLPPLYILHGDSDSFIPPSMGQALAAQTPGSHFELVPGADHADVVDVAQARLRALLAQP